MKNLKKYITLLAFLFLAVMPEAAYAEGGWWSIFFPGSDRNIPAETLTAPFSDPDAVVLEPEEGSVLSLNSRHMQNLEIAKWLEQKCSELVVYTSKNYQQEYRLKTGDFDPIGKAEYLQFLQKANILKPLSAGAYDIKGFAKDLPIVLTEGPLNGRYRWLFEVPIMVTYVKSGLNDYNDAKASEVTNVEFVIKIQLGRVDYAPNDMGVLIESWQAKQKNEGP